jgi:hypothetical protein
VVEEESVPVEGEVLAHQCQPRGLQRPRPVQPCPQQNQTSAVLPTLEVVLAIGLTPAMRRVQPREQMAQAIAPPSRREIALISDRGLITALVPATDPLLEQGPEPLVLEPTDRKSAHFPLVAIAPG